MDKENTVAVGFRIPVAVKEWLYTEAKKDDRSANWMFNKLLEDVYARAQQKEIVQQ